MNTSKPLFSMILPLPPVECSPNWRGHWAAKNRAAKKYKQTAKMLGLSKLRYEYGGIPPVGVKRVEYIHWFPTNHRRDADNYNARMKAGLDGLVLAGILPDDSGVYSGGQCQVDPEIDGPFVEVRMWGG